MANTAPKDGTYSHGSTVLEMCPETEAKKIFVVTRSIVLLSQFLEVPAKSFV